MEGIEKTRSQAADLSYWGFRKKRGRKEFYGGKGAAHGFRDLSVIKIIQVFEQPVTQMKTKFDEFMNGGRKGSP